MRRLIRIDSVLQAMLFCSKTKRSIMISSRLSLLLVFLLIASVKSSAQSGWSNFGPNGMHVNQIQSTGDGTIYVLGEDGLFRISPGDSVWTELPGYQQTDSRTFFAYDHVLMGFSGWRKTWYSHDQGEIWHEGERFPNEDSPLYKASVAVIGDSIFQVGPEKATLLRVSVDSARSWVIIDTLPRWSHLATDGSHLYAFGIGWLWLRDEDGEWSDISPDTERSGTALFASGDTLIFMTEITTYSFQHYRSFNRGQTWDTMTISHMIGEHLYNGALWGVDHQYQGVYTLPFSSNSWSQAVPLTRQYISILDLLNVNDTLFLGDWSGVYRKLPDDKEFRLFSPGVFEVPVNDLISVGDSLAIISPFGVYFSSPDTSTWQRRSFPKLTNFIAVDSVLYGFNNEAQALYRSDDYGLTVDSIGPGDGATNLKTVYVDSNLIIVAGEENIYRTTDGGRQWTKDTLMHRPEHLVGHGDTIFLRTDGSKGILGLRSFDGGVIWDTIRIPGISWLSHEIRYANGLLLVGAETQGVHRSTDFGNTWEKLDPRQEGETGDSLTHVTGIDLFGDTVFIGAHPRHDQFDHRSVVSFDGGNSWQALPGPKIAVRRFVLRTNQLFAGTINQSVIHMSLDTNTTQSLYEVGVASSMIRQVERNIVEWSSYRDGVYSVELYSIEGKYKGIVAQGYSQGRANTFDTNRIYLEMQDLPSGIYLCLLRIEGDVVATTSISVIR